MDNSFKTSSQRVLPSKKNISLQQNIITNTLINDIIVSKLTGQASIFQLGGLPGSGKTFVVRTIIDKLISIGLINVSQILICCKNNIAVNTVLNTMNENRDGDDQSIASHQLSTFHRMFVFPVIKEGMNTNQIFDWAPQAIYKNMEMYANTELLIIDEYMTMKCSEIIYIDALFRIVRHRPDIPFGGMTVIFLGDNRQNSAVLPDSPNRISFRANTDEECKSESYITKNYILKLIKTIFGENTQWTYGSRVLSVKTLKILNRLIDNLKTKINKAELRKSSYPITITDQTNIKNTNNINNFDVEILLNDSIFNDIRRACEEKIQPPNYERNTKNTLNDALEKKSDSNTNKNIVDFFADLSEDISFEKMVLDCLILRLNDIQDTHETLTKEKLREITNVVIDFVNFAMSDVITFDREKFFVLPTMAEEVEGEGQLSVPEREMLNILIVEGSDPNCLDQKYDFYTLREIKAVINSVLFKEGVDLESFYAPILKNYGEHVCALEVVKDENEFQAYVDKILNSIFQKDDIMNNNNNNNNNNNDDANIITIKKGENKAHNYNNDDDNVDSDFGCDDDDDDDDDDDNDNTNYKDGNFYYGLVIKPCEIPDGINPVSSVPYRLSKTIEWQKIIKEWDQTHTGAQSKLVAKARFWFFLKDLIKQELVRRGGNESINDDDYDYFPWSSSHFFLMDNLQTTPYWLRAFMIPFDKSAHRNSSQCLSAYTTYISMKAKSFTLNSLKRICLNRHVFGLSYAIAIKDLTTSYTMVDPRTLSSLTTATATVAKMNPKKSSITDFLENYFETLFPSIIKDFLFMDNNAIEEKKNELYSNIDIELLHKNLKGSNYSDQVKLLSTEMISTFIYERKMRQKDQGLATNLQTDNHPCSPTLLLRDRFEKMRRQMIKAEKKEDEGSRSGSGSEPVMKKKKVHHENGSPPENGKGTHKERHQHSTIVLTKTNSDKNAIAYLVSKVISEKSALFNDDQMPRLASATATNLKYKNNIETGTVKVKKMINRIDNVESFLFRTMFIIDNQILPSNVYSLSNTALMKIKSSFISHKTISNTFFINKSLDGRLKYNNDIRSYKNTLNNFKTNITKVDEVFLFKGQKVYFTHTNSITTYNFGTKVLFFTQDTGTVVNISKPYGGQSHAVVVSIAVDRLNGTIAHVSPFKYVEGKASVYFLPIASLLSMTVFSCQGTTLRSCMTLINPSRFTAQETYVALTRNDDVRDIKIITKNKSELEGITCLKRMLYSDGSRLYPMGVLGKKFKTLRDDKALYVDNVILDAVQHFLLDKSDNHLFFNQKWFEKVEGELERQGNVSVALKELAKTFLRDPSTCLRDLIQKSEEKLIDLFYACFLSIVNFNRVHECKVGKGSRDFSEFIRSGCGPTHLHKRPPVYVSPVIPRKSMGKIFYDIFPHSRIVAVFQVFANFIFLVYEIINIFNIDFAYFPSPSPLTHSRFGCPDHICLNWETLNYRNSQDCGWRENREPVTEKDKHCKSITQLGVGKLYNFNNGDCTLIEQNHVASSVLHNLRRNVKLDKQEQIAGTGIHGAIAISVDVKHHSDSMYCTDDKNNTTCISYDANIFSLLCFNTKLAAACGINKIPFNPLVECSENVFSSNYQITTPQHMLFCGKADPYKSFQFPIYFNRRKGDTRGIKGNLFSELFITNLLQGKSLSSIAFLWYCSIPSNLLGMEPINIRELICDNNIGILKSVKVLKRIQSLNNEIINHLTEEEKDDGNQSNNNNNYMVYLSIRLK
uniref:Wsv447-like protein n=1 Tax=Marsupenaeus japonicus endogenous nimavirus TaxID=2133793 RepID=A0A401IP76_9VIRU|nr:wsv447-like protein [Marsupenaeus japonicus endogenous nimavirus]